MPRIGMRRSDAGARCPPAGETNATLNDLWISGEISNLSRSSAGHIYFTLKDAAGQLRCAFFRRQNAGMKLEHGLQVVERNWRCRSGEIDVVARDGSTLVICEVKTRAGLNFGSPIEAVTTVKLARLRRLALRWLEDNRPSPPRRGR